MSPLPKRMPYDALQNELIKKRSLGIAFASTSLAPKKEFEIGKLPLLSPACAKRMTAFTKPSFVNLPKDPASDHPNPPSHCHWQSKKSRLHQNEKPRLPRHSISPLWFTSEKRLTPFALLMHHKAERRQTHPPPSLPIMGGHSLA